MNEEKEKSLVREKIAAIIVTYNRKELLDESLEALLNQTYPLDAIYLVDNASTDGTPEYLLERGFIDQRLYPDRGPMEEVKAIVWPSFSDKTLKINYIRMHENTGGAGGFYEGLRRAYEKGYDWFWMMDDDTIPSSYALQYLIDKIRTLSSKYQLGFVCSKVIWEGHHLRNIHKMNVPQIQAIINGLPFNELEDEGILIVKGASFVSFLIHKDVVRRIGYPIRQFFIWGDDIEYTRRIIRAGYIGLYVRESIVYHKTKDNYQVNIFLDTPENVWKYYYDIRNKLFMEKQSSLLRYAFAFIRNITKGNLMIWRKRKSDKLKFIWTNTLSSLASLTFNPKVE